MTKIAINGFGRIGRLFFRQIFDRPGIEVVVINDLGEIDNLAYLLKYDSVYGHYHKEITVDKGDLMVSGKKVKLIQEKDPLKLPWKNLGIDVVIESTGVFESFEKAKAHLDAGAKRVVITAPAKDVEGTAGGKTILMGINDNELQQTVLISNASCTTNAVSPVMAVMAENPGIQKAILTTAHAYTATQSIVDSAVKGGDFRRGRAGAQNIVPSTTGAALAVTRVLKDLEGKFDGIALRVPTITGSIADITFLAKRKTSVEEINSILKKAAESDHWCEILKVTDEQIVSSDIVGEQAGAIVDLKFTKVIDGDLVKILAWYDNEMGYVSLLIKQVLKIAGH